MLLNILWCIRMDQSWSTKWYWGSRKIQVCQSSRNTLEYVLYLTLFWSADNVWCLLIRVRVLHTSPNAIKGLRLVHFDGRHWFWGASSKYGFHCFNDLQPFKQCPDFEYRFFSHCQNWESIHWFCTNIILDFDLMKIDLSCMCQVYSLCFDYSLCEFTIKTLLSPWISYYLLFFSIPYFSRNGSIYSELV